MKKTTLSFGFVRKVSVFFLSFLTLFLPFTAFGADSFVPLADIPNIAADDNTTLVGFINSIFLFVVSIGAMLAVIRIVTGGFKYMTTEAINQKGEARNTIRDAILGLLLLLGVYLILTVINPDIVKLDALKFESLAPEGGFSIQPVQSEGGTSSSGGGSPQTGQVEPVLDSEETFSSNGTSGNKSRAEARAAQCRAQGGIATISCQKTKQFGSCHEYTTYCDSKPIDRNVNVVIETVGSKTFNHVGNNARQREVETEIARYASLCERQEGATAQIVEFCGFSERKSERQFCLQPRTKVTCSKPI